MLQTLQLSGVAYPTPPHDDLRPPPETEDVLVPAGPFTLGTNDEPWAYDNERPAHVVELPAFRIERHPVTNERFAEFLEDGGYRERRYWSDDGWRWLQAERVEAPLYWERGRGGWLRRASGSASRCRRPSRSSTSRSTRPKRSQPGPASGCRRRPSGRRPRRCGSRRRESRARLVRTPAGRPRASGVGCDACSATSGNGRRPPSPATRASRRFRTPSTRRSSSATSTACCAAARGRPIRWSHASRSGTGTSRSGGSSSAASAGGGRMSATRNRPPRSPCSSRRKSATRHCARRCGSG